ncbi:MAG: extracellular solute-binding protein [Spirochaetaceae bacterium]|jgi:iron(III) transport system substrate-binding protein|nr:extracellular solute-binding protein [Spirochaetaceae bacterium]
MKRSISSFVFVLLLSVTCVLLAAGCQKKSAAGGNLVIYSPNTEALVESIIPAFEKAAGVTVEIISAGTGECWKRIESEKNNPVADIMWGGQTYKDELVGPYVSANNNDVLPQFRNVNGVATPYCLDGSVLLVNNALLGGIKVEGYADLLNPALKGKLIMGDPANSSSAFAQLTNMLYDMGGGDYFAESGWNYVRELLVQLDGKIAQSSSAVHRGVAEGEYTVGITYEDPSASYVRDGADVRVVYMKEGVSFMSAFALIIKNSKNPENAKKFIDFLTGKEAQDIIGTQLTVRPVRGDAQLGTYMRPITEINLIAEDSALLAERKPEIVERYKALVTSLQK